MDSVKFENSSHLTEATYDAERSKLRVTFRGGSSYVYDGVPAAVWEGLIASPSAGKFLAAEIKPAYACERVS
jgi:hypothetical protein